ncbi:MAG: DNA-binding response regulator [Acidobacteria bacterium]|nr:MAG: DNA-binding response regulator [Acidobacteriota bacterium]REK03821.1 MAG: DNA-binding response regulator [Acidobacteriota bacterium]
MSQSSRPPARVLVVEDEDHLAESIVENLELEGHRVELVRDGAKALEELREDGRFDLVLLDVMLPEVDGFTVCETARARGVTTPILFLTARGAAQERVRGLRAGGDDYLAKPFHLEELLLRIEAILRRTRDEVRQPGSATFGDNRIDFRSYRAETWRGEKVELSHKEAMILQLLVGARGEVVSRDQILDRVWGHDAFPSSRTIDNFVVRLRRHFERNAEAPRFIQTVRGVGYRFDADG